MDRRDFLTLKNAGTVLPGRVESVRGINSGLNPYAGAWTNKEIAHLLKRTMFGAAKADMDFFRSMSSAQAVDVLLNVSAVPPAAPLKDYNNTDIEAGDPDLTVAPGTTWVNTISRDGAANFRRINSLKAWWTGLMLNQGQNLTGEDDTVLA
jgi:hypothetical protein